MIDAEDPAHAAHEVIAELDRLGALASKPRRPVAALMRETVPGKDVWVVCEGNLEQEVTRGTLELLSAGDELASKLGGALVAVGFPAAMRRHAGTLAGYGADRILILDHPALASRGPRRGGSLGRLVTERGLGDCCCPPANLDAIGVRGSPPGWGWG